MINCWPTPQLPTFSLYFYISVRVDMYIFSFISCFSSFCCLLIKRSSRKRSSSRRRSGVGSGEVVHGRLPLWEKPSPPILYRGCRLILSVMPSLLHYPCAHHSTHTLHVLRIYIHIWYIYQCTQFHPRTLFHFQTVPIQVISIFIIVCISTPTLIELLTHF